MSPEQVEAFIKVLTPEIQAQLRDIANVEGKPPMRTIDAGESSILIWMGPKIQIQQFVGMYNRALTKVETRSAVPR